MLAELIIKLDTNGQNAGFWQSSILQGILMEKIDPSYASFLHNNGWKPYSQYLEKKENECFWHICTLNKQAYEQIIVPMNEENRNSFFLRQKETEYKVLDRTLKTRTKASLMEMMYNPEPDRILDLQFLTPASFKVRGGYQILPDNRLIFQSLMNKYSAASDTLNMFDEETLEALCIESRISSYHLRSMYFPLEGTRIPAFCGQVRIYIGGKSTLAGYAQLMGAFGEYSGIGIKTAIGMGAVRTERRRTR